MSNLIGQGGFGCIYWPGITCKGNIEKTNKYVSKLQKKNLESENEYKIGLIVKSIKKYDKMFAPIIKRCNISLHEIDETFLSDCDIIKRYQKDSEFSLMKIKYVDLRIFY